MKTTRNWSQVSVYIKSGSIFLLFLLSALIVSCSQPSSNATGLNGPVVTVTISLGQNGAPATPQASYWCGAWTTNATPNIKGTDMISINAKFTKNNAGNPEGIGGANATATVKWGDGSSQILSSVTTTADGLAIIPVSIANRDASVGKISLVTVTFNKPGVGTCTVDNNRAAFFTIISAKSDNQHTQQQHCKPHKKHCNNNNNNNNDNNNNNNNGNNNNDNNGNNNN
ncbi:hypothetical protein [Ktedonosporobacter rubrisoli]|uniref:hypothetical protein n=1 Tax=Ktedonosporobacter rubrisoli TaxID=2509675 RepID=UPI0013EE62A1|nr:hypothetical protein [Ktedonosporobacter rubrisoli]